MLSRNYFTLHQNKVCSEKYGWGFELSVIAEIGQTTFISQHALQEAKTAEQTEALMQVAIDSMLGEIRYGVYGDLVDTIYKCQKALHLAQPAHDLPQAVKEDIDEALKLCAEMHYKIQRKEG